MADKFFIHESSYIDGEPSIGEGTSIWHFSHVQEGAIIGKNCTIGQNVNIASGVIIGDNVKIQNNVSIYSFCLRKPLPLWWGMNQTCLNEVKTLSHSPKIFKGISLDK